MYGSDAYTCPLKNFSKEALSGRFNALISNRQELKGKIEDAAKKELQKANENAGLFLRAMEMEMDDE
jgi:hypothetical protein